MSTYSTFTTTYSSSSTDFYYAEPMIRSTTDQLISNKAKALKDLKNAIADMVENKVVEKEPEIFHFNIENLDI